MSKVDLERRLADAERTLELTEDRLLESESRVRALTRAQERARILWRKDAEVIRGRLMDARVLICRAIVYIGQDFPDVKLLPALENYLEVKD